MIRTAKAPQHQSHKSPNPNVPQFWQHLSKKPQNRPFFFNPNLPSFALHYIRFPFSSSSRVVTIACPLFAACLEAVTTLTVVATVATLAVVAAVATLTVVAAVATLAVAAAVTTLAVAAAVATLAVEAATAALLALLTGLAGLGRLSKVELEGPLAELDILELLNGRLARLGIDEVSVGKTTGPASGTVNGNADVLEAVNANEDVVQLGIGGLVGDVAKEHAAGRLVEGAIAAGLALLAGLDADAATVPERAVDLGAGLLEGLTSVEGNESVTVDTQCVSGIQLVTCGKDTKLTPCSSRGDRGQGTRS